MLAFCRRLPASEHPWATFVHRQQGWLLQMAAKMLLAIGRSLPASDHLCATVVHRQLGWHLQMTNKQA
ncbi:MAG: hypothetical protein CFE39_04500 [Comamonadaceae bacterium PBBC2]|nr:MAG: hypothetical protein CFE39_04500 [Comamonadaceae bacterium PBBC2]